MGLGKILKKLKNPIKGIAGWVLTPTLKLGAWAEKQLLNALIDIPKPPGSIEQSGQLGNADARVNQSAIGDIKPIVIGKARVYFRYRSTPYTYFQGHDQVLAVWVHLGVGYCDLEQVRIGDTAANRFPGFQVEVYDPGEEMTLILPNVYTCPEIENGIELLGGALGDDSGAPNQTGPKDPIAIVTVQKFTDNGGTFEEMDLLNGRITANDDGFFADLLPGDVIGLYEASGNDGDYTVGSISDDYKSIVVTPHVSDDTQDTFGFFVKKRWAGPYPACPPGAQVDKIAIDIVFNALRDRDQADDLRGVIIKVQYREIDDAGDFTGSGAWTTADDGVSPYDSVYYIDNVNRQRRYTTEFELTGPMRCEVRLWRQTYEQADQEDPSSAATWVGLKGYIVALDADTPNVDDDSTTAAMLIRSSGFLSAASQKAVNGVVSHKAPIYESGGWSDPVATSNPWWNYAWWLTTQSEGTITLADLDVGEITDLANGADSRGATFDGLFDRQVQLWEGAQTICRVDRAKPIFDLLTRLYTGYRDEPSDPVQLFGDGFNCRVGQDSLRQPDADTVTGVQVRFMDPLLWQQREGPIVGASDDPRIVDFMGCTTWLQGWYEAQYEYRDLYYRTQSVSIETEMDGILPRHGKRVLLASATKGWGHSGEVIDWDSGELTLKVRPAPVWTTGMDHYVYLQDDDGTPLGPFNVSQGIADHYLVLESDPGITPRTAGGWKTLFVFGHDGDTDTDPDAPRIAIVMERKGDDPRSASLQLLFDNPFVHEDPGAPPDDPYATNATPPVLTITGLTAEAVISGVILEEDGDPLLDEDGNFIEEESGSAGVVVHVDWDDTAGATYYSMRWKKVGVAGWHAGYTGIASEADFGVSSNGTYQIRVKAYSGSYIGLESVTTIVISGF